MRHHYDAEPECKTEKENLIDLFCDMADVIQDTGDLDTIEGLKNFYNETIEKLNGKFVIEDYIKKRGWSFDNMDIDK